MANKMNNKLSNLTVNILTYKTNKEILKDCINSISKSVKINIIENVEVLYYRWKNVSKKFNMPIKLGINGQDVWIEPKCEWKNITLNYPGSKVSTFDSLYLIEFECIN